ncbi:hypothetical protein TIFTF001_036326 [Ficus carica]|uniref:Uncharacterized protein n=1 Tax=Ficus carica TaxID=3494 RepID=A0AA88E359_FICCA|nr:hypothetical protein TIFTF001_036326 [Ficus carica]
MPSLGAARADLGPVVPQCRLHSTAELANLGNRCCNVGEPGCNDPKLYNTHNK